MATHTIAWQSGGGSITLDYTGSGNESVAVSSSRNEGVDREQTLTFSTGEIDVQVVVRQEGLRQPFSGSDGKFLLSGGGQFLVLK